MLDELSRCRLEPQNMRFSIFHEKRVQGMALQDLQHHRGAMNPPASQRTTDEIDKDARFFQLDSALAAQFGCVLPLPTLDELYPTVRRMSTWIICSCEYKHIPKDRAVEPTTTVIKKGDGQARQCLQNNLDAPTPSTH